MAAYAVLVAVYIIVTTVAVAVAFHQGCDWIWKKQRWSGFKPPKATLHPFGWSLAEVTQIRCSLYVFGIELNLKIYYVGDSSFRDETNITFSRVLAKF